MGKSVHTKVPRFFKDCIRRKKVFPNASYGAFLDLDGTLIREHTDFSLMDFTLDLWSFLEEEHITPFILSANESSHVLKIQKHVHISPEHIFSSLQKKEDCFEHILSEKKIHPILTMGNHWIWDGPILRKTCDLGGVSLLVNDGGISNYTHPSLFYFSIR